VQLLLSLEALVIKESAETQLQVVVVVVAGLEEGY
jgi:hypothetical protein